MGSTDVTSATGTGATRSGTGVDPGTGGNDRPGGGSTSGDSTGAATCEGEVEYQITFVSDWDDPAVDLRRFGALVGSAHPARDPLFSVGSPASPGLVDIAEGAGVFEFRSEIGVRIAQGRARMVINGPVFDSPGSTTATFTIAPQMPSLTMVSGMSSSPDWFAGLTDVNLCEEGQWVDTITLPAIIYDAGTDSGTEFGFGGANDIPTDPVEPISEHPTFEPVGTWAIERTDL